jgi:hypothetical protein
MNYTLRYRFGCHGVRKGRKNWGVVDTWGMEWVARNLTRHLAYKKALCMNG